MALETGNYLNDLNETYPTATDTISEGDGHLQLIKKVLKQSFAGVDRASEYIYVHTSAPTADVGKGRLWLDTSTTPNLLKICNDAGPPATFIKLPISATVNYKLMGNDTVGWVLPTADGTANYPLTTTGSNVLAFAQIDTTAIANNAVDGTKIAMGSDAAGDVLYYNGTDYVRLAKGTAGQHLAMNSGVTAPEWVSTGVVGSAQSSRTGYSDIRTTSYSDVGQSITYTVTDASSTLYVYGSFNGKLWSSFDDQNEQWAKVILVYATSTTTGISPTTDLLCAYMKEDGMEPTATAMLGFGYSAFWKITGLSAAAYTFKIQGKVKSGSGTPGDGGCEFTDGSMLVLEVV